jgi:hypothetical protein
MDIFLLNNKDIESKIILHENLAIWVGYGMEMDSYKSPILDGVLMGSGTKTKS